MRRKYKVIDSKKRISYMSYFLLGNKEKLSHLSDKKSSNKDNEIECFQWLKAINEDIIITSIDPGRDNFAMYFQKRKYRDKTHETLDCVNFSLDKSTHNSSNLRSLAEMIEQKKELILSSQIIIIEKQIGLNARTNRLELYVVGILYSLFNHSDNDCLLIRTDSRLKTLGQKKMKGKQVKRYSESLANNLLEERNDNIGLEMLNDLEKKDDISDCIIQIESVLNHISLTKFI